MSSSNQSSNAPSSKIVLVGGGGVGKSCLTIQFVQHHFDDTLYDPTIEDSYVKQIATTHTRKVEIIDTAGQEEYLAMVAGHLRTPGATFLICFDITSRASFDQARDLAVRLARAQDVDTLSGVPCVLVGTKCDMESARAVTTTEAQDFARDDLCGARYFETSAKRRVNVDEVFNFAADLADLKVPKAKKLAKAGAPAAATRATKKPFWKRLRFVSCIALDASEQ